MKEHKSVPTDSELEILQLLWQHGPQPVRVINELINEKREVGYTTTLKIMQIMSEKGMLTRDTSSRTHIYQADKPQEETTNNLLSKIIRTAYNGSASKLIMQALGNHKASDDELKEIKSLIQEIENKNNG
jgi:BlaI family penicillinase repressor